MFGPCFRTLAVILDSDFCSFSVRLIDDDLSRPFTEDRVALGVVKSEPLLSAVFFESSLPRYLFQTLCAYEPTRNLRSSYEKLLRVPKHNTKTYGESSFSFLVPPVWNSLPSDLRNASTLLLFKSRLRTHLFMIAFCH